MTLPKVGLPGGRVLSAHTPGHGPVQEQPTRSQVLASYLPLKIRERRPSDKGLFLKNTDQPADQVTTDESSSSRRPRLALPGSTTSQQGAVSLQVVTAAVQGRVGDADQCKGVASALNDAVVNLAAASGQAIDVRTTQAIALTDTSPEARAQQLSDACKQWAASLEAGLVDCVVVIASGSGQGLAGTLGNAPKHRGLITAFTGHQLSSDLLSSKQLPDVVALPNSTVGDAEAAVLTERTRLVRTKGVPHSFTDSAVAQAVAAYGAKGHPPLPAIDHDTIVVVLGGDAPDMAGQLRRFSETDARALARRIAAIESKRPDGGCCRVIVTNGPRTGRHDESGKVRDPDPHRSGHPDVVTQAFVTEIGQHMSVDGLLDFQFAALPSALMPLVDAFRRAPAGGRWHLGGESSSMVSQLGSLLGSALVIDEIPSMSEAHHSHVAEHAEMVGATILREDGTLDVISPKSNAASTQLSAADQVAETILDVAALRAGVQEPV